MSVDSRKMERELGEARRWLVGAGVVMAVEGLGLGRLVGFSRPRMEGEEGEFILTMVIAGVILLSGVVIALIGILNRASIATGIGVILAATLSLLGVFVAFAQADEGGSFLLLAGLASLVAGLAGFDVVRQARRPVSVDPER